MDDDPEGISSGGNGGERKAEKRQNISYTVAQKLAILEEADEDITMRKAVAEKHGITPRTMQRWQKQRRRLQSQLDEDSKGNFKRVRVDNLERIKTSVINFKKLKDQQTPGLRLPFTDTEISSHALFAKDHLLKKHEESNFLSEDELKAIIKFDASMSWASKFAKRQGWRSIVLHGEAGDVGKEEMEADIELLRMKIAEYGMENVYNMHETGLFFKLLPNRAYVSEEDIKSARGTKAMKSKDRITIYICANANGTDKVPLGIIGKLQKPRCFAGRELPFHYYSQKKAWSDTKVFFQWWEDFLNHIRCKTTNKILLIMDNCGPHGVGDFSDPSGQVEIAFLPLNCTGVCQPMDAGVISQLKRHYRYMLLQEILEVFEDRKILRERAKQAKMLTGTTGLAQGHPPHVYDAISILDKVWSHKVTATHIFNCWRKSNLIENNKKTDEPDAESEQNHPPQQQPNNAERTQPDEDALQLLWWMKSLSLSDMETGDIRESANEFDAMIEEAHEALALVDVFDAVQYLEEWIALEELPAVISTQQEEVEMSVDLDILMGFEEAPAEPEDEIDEDDARNDVFAHPTDETIYNIAVQTLRASTALMRANPDYHKAAAGLQDIAFLVEKTHANAKIKKKRAAKPTQRPTDIGALF